MIPNGWITEHLGDVSYVTKLAGYEYTEHFDYSIGGEIIVVRAINVTNKGFDLSNIHTVEKSISEKLPRSKLHKNDLVLVYVGATIGKITVVQEDNVYHLGPNVAKITPNRDFVDPTFLLQQMQSLVFQYELQSHVGSTSQPALSMENLRKAKVIIPPLDEQRKIAAILSTWDEAIGLVEQLIAALGRRKQALMQLLLTGAVRFPGFEGEWEEVELGEIAIVRRGASPRPIKDPKWFSETGRAWIRIADVTASPTRFLNQASQYLSPLGEEKSVKIEVGELIMSIAATVGVPKIVNIPACIHDGFIVLRDFEDNATKEFLYHHLSWQTKRLANSGQPGTQVNINSDLVREIDVPKLSLAEQEKIASVLTESEEELYVMGLLVEQLQEQKRGLMQQLLTGQVRV